MQRSLLSLATLVSLAVLGGCGSASEKGEISADGGGGVHRNDAGVLVDDAGTPVDDAGNPTSDSGGTTGPQDSSTGVVDSGPPGSAITCPGPGNYTHNGGSCGTERWDIKTGTDPYTNMVSLVPKPTTIATLAALPAAGGGTMRESPTEVTLFELTDVTLTELKSESDSDEHLVLSDGTHTMIAEIPYPTCAMSSTWLCFISRARAEVDAKYTVSSSPQYPAATVTVRGVGFFDYLHGQNGVAPNAIELHPVLQICFGQGCTPS